MLKKKLVATGLATMMTIASMIAMPVNVFAADNINDQQVEANISFEIRDTNDLAVLSEELDKFIAQNPHSTEFEQEQHLISFMKNGGLNRVSLRSIGDYLPGYNSLNSAERKLALAHPIQAVKVIMLGIVLHRKLLKFMGKTVGKIILMLLDIVCGMH